jgi:hypothetical protein
MKKTLLMCAALVLGSSAFAQNGRQVMPKLQKQTLPKNRLADAEAFPTAPSKVLTGPAATKSSALCSPAQVTSAFNVLTMIGNGSTQQNMISYNKDLNTCVLTHRMSVDWPLAGAGSGWIMSNWKNITTGLWDSTVVYRPSTMNGRFPGGIHFNPVGDNTMANSHIVAFGPTVVSSFDGHFWNNRQLTGNYYTPPTAGVNAESMGGPTFGYLDLYQCNSDLQQVGNTVWMAGALTDPNVPSANVSAYQGAVIVKGAYSGGNFTWTRDSIIPGYFIDNNTTNGYASLVAMAPRIAFDPSGNIGYVVMFGVLQNTYGNSADSMVSPIVYKTTNGGSTWAPVMLGYDWNSAHPECLLNCWEPAMGTPKNFSFGYGYYQTWHGTDVTVDAMGTLHLVTTVNAPINDGASKDSMNYGYTMGYWDYATTHPIIWDFMTDGSCWKTMMVDSIIASFVGDASSDTTRLANPWEAGAGSGSYYGYGAHLTVARSTDGTKIIYGWGDSDPSSTGSVYNNAPDMIMKAYDINTQMFTPTTNVTNGIGTCYYSFITDQAYMDNTQNKWVAPFTYAVGRVTTTAGYDAHQPVNIYYGDCGAFGASDFTVPATINNDLITSGCAVGIQSNNNFVLAVNNYPNPFNHNTNIVVTLNEAKPIVVNVYDALGKLVFTKKTNGNVGDNTIAFDGSSLNAGVYHYTVTAGYEKVTKKMVIQK